jgi:hypothetical protein
MLVRFIDHLQALRRQGAFQLLGNPFSHCGHDRDILPVVIGGIGWCMLRRTCRFRLRVS